MIFLSEICSPEFGVHFLVSLLDDKIDVSEEKLFIRFIKENHFSFYYLWNKLWLSGFSCNYMAEVWTEDRGWNKNMISQIHFEKWLNQNRQTHGCGQHCTSDELLIKRPSIASFNIINATNCCYCPTCWWRCRPGRSPSCRSRWWGSRWNRGPASLPSRRQPDDAFSSITECPFCKTKSLQCWIKICGL